MKYNYDERQLRALCFTASLAPVSRLLPKATARIAGSGSWIAPLIALPILLIFILLLSQFMKMRRDGEGLGELVLRTGGSVFGGFTLVFLSAFMIFEGGFILRSAANRFISTIYPAAEPWFFIAIMLIMGAVASLGAVKALPRAARIFAPVLVAVLLLTLFFAFSQVEPSKLLPISRSDTPDLFLSSLVVVEIYAGMLIFTAVLEDQCQRRDRFKSLALWIVPICLLLTAFCCFCFYFRFFFTFLRCCGLTGFIFSCFQSLLCCCFQIFFFHNILPLRPDTGPHLSQEIFRND